MVELPFYKVLKDKTRQRILCFIGEKGRATYTEILMFLNTSTGKLNYHLKILSSFLLKSNEGYSLNEMGESAYSMMTTYSDPSNTKDRLYRNLTWVLIPFSFLLIIILNGYVQIFGIAALFAGVFFFYNSNNTKTRIWEFLVILFIATVAGSSAILLSTYIAYHLSLSFSLDIKILPAAYSIVLFATMLNWTLTSYRRWLVVIAIMLFISLFPFVVVITSSISLGPDVTTGTIIPIPAFFLLVSVISMLVMRFNSVNPNENKGQI